jgi:carbonic anhydrase
VLSCSDSRVVPEIIFDQGLGDLFMIRVAGNVAENSTLGSLEYAVHHLEIPIIVVLGHTKCGALTAALAAGAVTGRLAGLMGLLQPAVQASLRSAGDPLENAVFANVRITVDSVKRALQTGGPGSFRVIGAVYDIDTGCVSWMDD